MIMLLLFQEPDPIIKKQS